MTQYELEIIPTKEVIQVNGVATHKEARNRSLANASDCCGVPLKQEKRCGKCNEAVIGKPQRKIFKVGKQEYLITTAAEEAAKDLGANKVVVERFINKKDLPSDVIARIEKGKWIVPEDKYEQKFANALQLFNDERVGIGKVIDRDNEYECFILRKGNALEVEMLCDPSQVNECPSVELPQANAQVAELLQKIAQKNTVEHHEFNHRDARLARTEELLREVVTTGKVPDIQQRVAEKQEGDEVERLKALLGE